MTVDILFPFYGDVALMKQAVRSIIGQTNPDWRLVVVDDGYPDDSIPGWFESLDDSRITYMRNEKNLGANGNYTKALSFVENDLVTVMGADDVMLPNYIDWLVEASKRPLPPVDGCGAARRGARHVNSAWQLALLPLAWVEGKYDHQDRLP